MTEHNAADAADAADIVIVDAQVHGPQIPGLPERPATGVRAGFMGRRTLSREMQIAGVARAVLVPGYEHGVEECIQWAVDEPDKYAVMPTLELEADRAVTLGSIPTWKQPGVLGMRLSFWGRTPRVDATRRNLLQRAEMDWLWEANEAAGIPVMVLAPSVLPALADVATRYPGLRIIVDHMGVIPGELYEDFDEVLVDLLPLAAYPNIGVKVSALPRASQEVFPFPRLHEPIERVYDAFGPERTFWGSDLSTLTIPYSDYVELFTDRLPFLSHRDKQLVMGESLCEWLDWPLGR
jgi:L-fuconolactonase